MWPKYRSRHKLIKHLLKKHSGKKRYLPGIGQNESINTLAMQMIASIRRLDYTKKIKHRNISPERMNPNSVMFDPERAAVLYARQGNMDEAIWIIFLATHFGKNLQHGWQLLADVYSGLGEETWTWARISSDPTAFRAWLASNESRIRGAFGNHRKYESLKVSSKKGTASVIESYIRWIGPTGHQALFQDIIRSAGNNPHEIFDKFYNRMEIERFGRLGKFDFLTLIGRLDLAPITPGSTYLAGATGPTRGARLLYGGDTMAKIARPKLEKWLVELDDDLNLGAQILEDSLCNWQKSPLKFIHFLG